MYMAVAGGCFYTPEFTEEKNSENQSVIVASLDASIFKSPRLVVPSPAWGDPYTRYVPLNLILEVCIGKKLEYVETLSKTIYCRMRKSESMDANFLQQKSKKEMPNRHR